jgi:hypothetical protein
MPIVAIIIIIFIIIKDEAVILAPMRKLLKVWCFEAIEASPQNRDVSAKKAVQQGCCWQ